MSGDLRLPDVFRQPNMSGGFRLPDVMSGGFRQPNAASSAFRLSDVMSGELLASARRTANQGLHTTSPVTLFATSARGGPSHRKPKFANSVTWDALRNIGRRAPSTNRVPQHAERQPSDSAARRRALDPRRANAANRVLRDALRNIRRRAALVAATLLALATLAGCGPVKEKPGNPDSFTSAVPTHGALRSAGSA